MRRTLDVQTLKTQNISEKHMPLWPWNCVAADPQMTDDPLALLCLAFEQAKTFMFGTP